MIRDFTEKSKQKLLGLVKEVKDEQWCGFTDALGDGWLDFEAWAGKLDVTDYLSKMDKYHKKVIDKNDTTAKEIEAIFKEVNAVNTQYCSCFGALLSELKMYTQQLVNLSITIDPSNGMFNSDFIGNGLKHSMDEYMQKKKVMDAINSDEGLTEQKMSEIAINDQSAQDVLQTYGDIMLDSMPNVKVGDELEVPIGPGMVFYYKVSGSVKGEGNINLDYVIEDQKLKLKKYSYKTDSIVGVSASANSEGDFVIESSGEHAESEVNFKDGTVSYSYKDSIGNSEIKYTFEFNAVTGELKVEESVTTEVDGVSVSSTIGIRKSQNSNWKPMPVPVPVTSPYVCQIPEFDIDWQEVGTVLVTATAVVVVVAGAAVLVYATGGAAAPALLVLV